MTKFFTTRWLAAAFAWFGITLGAFGFFSGAFETAFTNMRELAEIMANSNKESMDKLNSRLAESIDEMQAMTVKFKN